METAAGEKATAEHLSSTPSTEPEPGQWRYDAEREIRFAVVLYGGVSLAVYIYGVTMELLRLVHATAPSTTDKDALALPTVKGTAQIYRELATRIHPAGEQHDHDSRAVRCRFVVDIISGSSAGGLNGLLLAAALACDNDQPEPLSLEPLERLWIDEGDLGKLLHDPADEKAESFLRGKTMFTLLDNAVSEMTRHVTSQTDCRSRLVEQLDLWITTTDLQGLETRVSLTSGVATDRQHANTFHFRYDKVEPHNDFHEANADLLAFAGRSTAAFPGAFAPARLTDVTADGAAEPGWDAFYRDYRGADPSFVQRSHSDGGILDNKPFTHATRSLAGRRARLPVQRKLLYVEPDPSPSAAPPRMNWNAIATAQAALVGIPRTETIRADIEALLRRNLVINRSREVLALAGNGVADRNLIEQGADRTISRGEWLTLSLQATIAKHPGLGPTYSTYHRLKVREVVDYLARCLGNALELPADSATEYALRYVVRAWRESRYSEKPQHGVKSDNEFLFFYDVPFRIRRLGHVLLALRELELGNAEGVTRLIESSGIAVSDAERQSLLGPGARRICRTIRQGLSDALDALVRVRAASDLPEPTTGELDQELGQELAQAGINEQWLSTLVGKPDAQAVITASANVPAPPSTFLPLEIMRERIESAVLAANRATERAIGKRPTAGSRAPTTPAAVIKRLLRRQYDAFEAADLVLLPLSVGTEIIETVPVEVHRVSPLEHTPPENVTHTELLGAKLHHFASFLDPAWRRHDITWGRMNAAEQLIRVLIPNDQDLAEKYVQRAQEIIIDDYRKDAEVPGDQYEEGWLGGVKVKPLGPDTLAQLLQRGGLVAGNVAANAFADQRGSEAAGLGQIKTLRRILPTERSWIKAVLAGLAATFGLLLRQRAAGRGLIVALLVVVGLALAERVTDVESLGWAALVVAALVLGFAVAVVIEVVVGVTILRRKVGQGARNLVQEVGEPGGEEQGT